MARVETWRRRETYWRTSDQKQRWCAAAFLALDAQFRRIKGHQDLTLWLLSQLNTKKRHFHS